MLGDQVVLSHIAVDVTTADMRSYSESKVKVEVNTRLSFDPTQV